MTKPKQHYKLEKRMKGLTNKSTLKFGCWHRSSYKMIFRNHWWYFSQIIRSKRQSFNPCKLQMSLTWQSECWHSSPQWWCRPVWAAPPQPTRGQQSPRTRSLFVKPFSKCDAWLSENKNRSFRCLTKPVLLSFHKILITNITTCSSWSQKYYQWWEGSFKLAS